jgi:hypothetical protein
MSGHIGQSLMMGGDATVAESLASAADGPDVNVIAMASGNRPIIPINTARAVLLRVIGNRDLTTRHLG